MYQLKKPADVNGLKQHLDSWYLNGKYGSTGCGVFKRGYKIRKIFA